MKFIHMADMHFDAPFTVLSNRTELGGLRRIEQREALKKIIEYIKQNEIPYLFIAGDFYEHEYVRESTIEYINNQFKQIPNTRIFIVPGNHDPYLKNSFYHKYCWNENVHIFTNEIQKFEEEEFDLYGYGFDDFYCKNKINEIQIENKEKLNILLTHGSVDSGLDINREYNPMTKKNLLELPFKYYALGHIHKREESKNEPKKIVYPGSTIAMGFDELGEHGVILGEIENGKIDTTFLTIDTRQFQEIKINVTECNTIEDLIQKINELNIQENNFYKIILEGKRKYEINLNYLYKIIHKNIIKIKNRTKLDINIEELSNEISLKGLFVNEIKRQIEKGELPEEILNEVLEIGLEVL